MLLTDQAVPYQIYAWTGHPNDRPSGCAVAYLVARGPVSTEPRVYLYAVVDYVKPFDFLQRSVYFDTAETLLNWGYTRYTGDLALTEISAKYPGLAVLTPETLEVFHAPH